LVVDGDAMLQRLRLVIGSLMGSLVLLVALCLGSQNLDERRQLQLGVGRTVPLPTGFVVGVALALGVASGGLAAALLLPGRDQLPGRE
jgi:hypothetical protein